MYTVPAKIRRVNKVWPHKLIPLETTWVSQTRKATGSGDNRSAGAGVNIGFKKKSLKHYLGQEKRPAGELGRL